MGNGTFVAQVFDVCVFSDDTFEESVDVAAPSARAGPDGPSKSKRPIFDHVNENIIALRSHPPIEPLGVAWRIARAKAMETPHKSITRSKTSRDSYFSTSEQMNSTSRGVRDCGPFLGHLDRTRVENRRPVTV